MVSLGNCENILERDICYGYYAHLHITRMNVVQPRDYEEVPLNSNYLQGNKEIEQQEKKGGQ